MNMGKKITDLSEGSAIPGESRYPVSMGDGTGVKQVKHSTLVEQLLSDMEMPYDETLAMLTETGEDGTDAGGKRIPNLRAISDWIMSRIVNSLLATEEGFFLDARIGTVLDQRITANANAISSLNSDLADLWGNATNTEAIVAGGAQWQRWGRICILYVAANISIGSGWYDKKIFTNVPPCTFLYSPLGVVQHQESGSAHAIFVNQSGEVYIRPDNRANDGWNRGSIVYVCN